MKKIKSILTACLLLFCTAVSAPWMTSAALSPEKTFTFSDNSVFDFVAQDCQWNVNNGKLNTNGTDGDHWLYLGEAGKGWQNLSVSFDVTVTDTNIDDHNFRIQMKEGGSGNHETFYRATTWGGAGSGNFIESYTGGAGFNSINYTNAFSGFAIDTTYNLKSMVLNDMLSIFIDGVKIVEASVFEIGSDSGRICMTFWNCAVTIDNLVLTNETNSTVIYQNDFSSSDDTLAFQPANCQWYQTGSVLKTTGNNGERSIWMGEPGKGWDNCEVEFSFKLLDTLDSDYNVNLMMREGGSGNFGCFIRGYDWTHAGSGNFVSIYRGGSEYASGDYKIPFTGLVPNQSYTVKYVIEGDNSKLYIDGALLMDVTDSTLTSGRARIAAFNCNIELSHVRLSPSGCSVNYDFNFSTGNMSPLGADAGWEIADGVLKTKNNIGEKYVWGNDSTYAWTDYGYQMDVTFVDSSSTDYQLNLFIRESSGGNYMAGLRGQGWLHAGSQNFIEIYQSGAGGHEAYLSPFRGFATGKTYTVAFAAVANRQMIYVNGAKILEVTDTDSKFAAGRPGFSASNCNVTIDNLKLFAPEYAPEFSYQGAKSIQLKSGSGLNISNGIVSRVTKDMTMESVLAQCEDAEFLTADFIFATGAEISLFVNGETEGTVTLAVAGDITGDGMTTAEDIVELKKYLLSIEPLAGAYEKAADIDMNGQIEVSDIVVMKKEIVNALNQIEGTSVVPQAKFTAQKVYTLPQPDFNDSLTLSSVQGQLANIGTEQIYVVPMHSYVQWLDVLKTDYGVQEVTGYDTWSLVNKFKSNFKGYILCKTEFSNGDNTNESIQVATSLAAQYNAVVVTQENEALVQSMGLTKLLDVREWTQAYLLTQPQFAKLNKNAIFEGPLWLSGIRDLAVMANSLMFYSKFTGNDVHSLVNPDRSAFFAGMTPNSPLFGWGDMYNWSEAGFVGHAANNSLYTICSDHGYNFSTLSGFSGTTMTPKNSDDGIQASQGKHTVSFLMTDGDNVQWFLNTLGDTQSPEKEKWFASSSRGTYKMGWGMAPTLIDLSAPTMKYFYENATQKDSFVAVCSGLGYTYPSEMPPQTLSAHLPQLNTHLGRIGLNTMQIMDKSTFENRDDLWSQYAALPNVDAMIYIDYLPYHKYGGKIRWYNNKPFISARYSLWDDLAGCSVNEIKTSLDTLTLSADATNPTKADAYSLIMVHAWSDVNGTMKGVKELTDLLNQSSQYQVVTPDEFTRLVNHNVTH